MSDEGLTGEITFVSKPYNQGWMWGRIVLDGSKARAPTTIVGSLTGAYAGMRATLLGEWVEHEKYGKQFKVSAMIPSLPTNDTGVKEWLIQHIPHIGEVRAADLMRTYGTRLWEVLDKDPMRLARDINGITSDRVDEIVKAYQAAKMEREERVRLYKIGFTQSEASRLLEVYGRAGTASSIAETDPHAFFCAGRAGISFARAEAVFHALDKSADSPGRLRAAVVAAFQSALDDGDTLLGAGDLFEKMEELLALHDDGSAYRNALHAACAAGLVTALGDDEYMDSSAFKSEFYIANTISGLLALGPVDEVDNRPYVKEEMETW